jgi:hypothetical protein
VSEKIIETIAVGNTPFFEIVEETTGIGDITLRYVDNHDKSLKINKSMLYHLAPMLQKIYDKYEQELSERKNK